jgi:hypothetical protein
MSLLHLIKARIQCPGFEMNRVVVDKIELLFDVWLPVGAPNCCVLDCYAEPFRQRI